MDNLDDYLLRLRDGPGLTRHECTQLVALAKLAAQFTEANDLGDDLSERLDSGDIDSEEEDRLLESSDQADIDYNATKAALFGSVREFMGWPARVSAYPEATHAAGPHPFAQEGSW
jgi:hypothetical protein